MKHIWKIKKVAFAKKEKNAMKLQKVTFQKSQKLFAENLAKGRLFRTFNSYSFNFKGGLCNRRTGYIVHTELLAWEVSSFCDFWKMTCDFTLFYSFLTKENIIFLDMLGKEYYS